MNLLQVIHERWAATAALEDVLSATSVFTGMAFDPTLPFAVIEKNTDNADMYANDGMSVDSIGVRMQIFHENHDDGAEILHQVKTAFNRTEFDLSGNDRVVNMHRTNDFEIQEEDGAWRFVIDFNCRTYLAAGV